MNGLLHPKRIYHDIYVIATQEALKSIVGSMFSPSKELMNQMIQECLGDQYVMIASVSLQATHLVVFSTTRLSPLISNIQTDYLATGFKNMVGNKGAVKISLNLVDTSLTFINAHLHSGLNGVAKRNDDIMQIMARFVYFTELPSQKNKVMPVQQEDQEP